MSSYPVDWYATYQTEHRESGITISIRPVYKREEHSVKRLKINNSFEQTLYNARENEAHLAEIINQYVW